MGMNRKSLLLVLDVAQSLQTTFAQRANSLLGLRLKESIIAKLAGSAGLVRVWERLTFTASLVAKTRTSMTSCFTSITLPTICGASRVRVTLQKKSMHWKPPGIPNETTLSSVKTCPAKQRRSDRRAEHFATVKAFFLWTRQICGNMLSFARPKDPDPVVLSS